MRILCLDIGTRRIGVAVSDPMGWTAQPVGTIIRRGGVRDFESIACAIRDQGAQLVVIGLPLGAEGESGPQAQKVKAFAAKLKRHLEETGQEVPFEFWDERYSTATAEERLIEADVSRVKRRRVIDKMAAAVILDDYLRAHEG